MIILGFRSQSQHCWPPDLRSLGLNLRAAFGRLFFWPHQLSYFRSWHLSDMVGLADDVGFRGYSGSRIPGASGLSLTPSETLALPKQRAAHHADRSSVLGTCFRSLIVR